MLHLITESEFLLWIKKQYYMEWKAITSQWNIKLTSITFWGAFVKSDFKSWDSSAIEKTHLQFCKRYLQVHNKASNTACRAELGKFPMIIDINKKILNYLDYLVGKDEDSIVKQALQISIDLHHNGKTSFYSNLMKMVDYYDLNYDFSCNSLSDSIVNWYIGIMKNKYVSYWN